VLPCRETAAPCREMFEREPVERRPAVVTARFRRAYSCLSDTRLPNSRGIPLEVGARAADLKRLVAEIAKRAGDVTVATAADEVAAACDAILPANGPLRRV
jgi:hypothetical protein